MNLGKLDVNLKHFNRIADQRNSDYRTEYARDKQFNPIDSCSHRSLLLNLQGVLGIKVKIMLDWDPKGKQGPTTPLPDLVTIHAPKEEEELVRPVVVPQEI